MSVFIPISKKGNAKEYSNYCTVVLITHASKIMLKILQARLQQHMNQELSEVQTGFGRDRKNRDQIAKIHWIMEKARESPQKTSTLASLTMLKSRIMLIPTNWKILKEMGIADPFTCLLRNLYVGQESEGRTRHGTTD